MDLDSDPDGVTMPSPSKFFCVGTREVTMQTGERGKSLPSILACFKQPKKESDNGDGNGGGNGKILPSVLTLMFTDGSRTYSGR